MSGFIIIRVVAAIVRKKGKAQVYVMRFYCVGLAGSCSVFSQLRVPDDD